MNIRTHNVLDYVIAIALILAPYVFGFSNIQFARDVFLVLGLTLAGYSLLTEYEYSFGKIIPLPMHMTLDVVSGVFLMLAPMIYEYREELSGFQYALHFVMGAGVIALVLFTERRAEPPALLLDEPDEITEQRAA
jgi:hypothetical protein